MDKSVARLVSAFFSKLLGSFNIAYYCPVALLAVVAVATFIVKPPHGGVGEHVRNPGQWR